MNANVRELLDIARRLGFTYEGIDGQGHHALRHENGEPYRIPATPSEFRGHRNAIAAMERISGRKVPRPNAGRSRKAPEKSGFDLEAATREARRREIARVVAENHRQALEQAAEAKRRALMAEDDRRRQIEYLMRPGYGR